MDINLKRFVNIDIEYQTPSTINSTRDLVALLTTEGTKGTSKIISSLAEFDKDSDLKTLVKTRKYAAIFFDNGGSKLNIVCGITSTDLETTISNLPNEQILVAYCGEYSELKKVAQSRTSKEGTTSDITKIYGINQKILLGRTTSAEDLSEGYHNFAVKVSKVDGAEMTMAAYLSKINVYGINTINDYAFTVENIMAETNDDAILGTVLDNNMNVDMKLANAIRNLGGNLVDGKDLVNQYTLIILHQTVTDRLISLLTTKLKGNTGLSSIYTTIAGELSRYVTNGYLTTDKTWNDETKTIMVNNKTYTLIEKGTRLLLGHQIVVLPFSALTQEEQAQKKCPPIYIFLADSYGIRSITINGEVI